MRMVTVYPACAGIDPFPALVSPNFLCLPRMRGDRPQAYRDKMRELGFTPHARGSTGGKQNEMAIGQVYPACAGIDLTSAG